MFNSCERKTDMDLTDGSLFLLPVCNLLSFGLLLLHYMLINIHCICRFLFLFFYWYILLILFPSNVSWGLRISRSQTPSKIRPRCGFSWRRYNGKTEVVLLQHIYEQTIFWCRYKTVNLFWSVWNKYVSSLKNSKSKTVLSICIKVLYFDNNSLLSQ